MTTPLRLEHWGTFEVENFGDLLYPVVLEHHFGRLLPGTEISLAGPMGGVAGMGLGRPVRRAVRHDEHGFWTQAADVDAIVLGGGDLVHASAGVVSAQGRAQRLDAWSFAAEAGLLAEVRPFVWNGVGVPFEIPAELAPLLRHACRSIDLLTVRDEGSRARLEAAGVDRAIEVVPDTATLVTDVFTSAEREAAAHRLRSQGRLPPPDVPAVVVHASFVAPGALYELAAALDQVEELASDGELVLVALGPTHGDAAVLRSMAARLQRPCRVITTPSLIDVVALLGVADVVVTSSYHAVLVSSLLGTPAIAFGQPSHRPAKLVDLSRALGRERWLVDRPSVVTGALGAALRGEAEVDPAPLKAMAEASRAHLERVARTLTRTPPRSVDLDERSAAHGHLVDRLRLMADREHRLRQDLHVVDRHLRGARTSARTWEAAFWRLEAQTEPGIGHPSVLDLDVLRNSALTDFPYRWGLVGPLFAPDDAVRLAQSFPLDEAELREGCDGQRSWRYLVRCLLPMGRSEAVRPHALDPIWRRLADDLAGSAYRDAISAVTGVDVSALHLEANLFSYGAGGYQEPHPDLPEKIVTHVLWFNEDWDASYGGCLRILRSKDPDDIDRELLPELGWSALFVRSASSWHSVTAVTDAPPAERRALVVTFHRPGSVSSMWGEALD